MRAGATTFEGYLDEHPRSLEILDRVREVLEGLGPVHEHLTRSQVAFRRTGTVVRAWAPGQYLEHGAPLVLTFAFDHVDGSPRWKEVVEPRAGVFVHHLELRTREDVDDEVRAWLTRAYRSAADPPTPRRRRRDG